jgi:uncharacterized repeat protein (TIGR04138 family)
VIELRLAAGLLAKIRAAESHYDELAYLFVLESIEFLQTRLPTRRHVTGAEVAHGCREYALSQYGLMARQVLDHWGIRRTDDFGRIVFTLVEVGLLMTQPTDSEADFRAVYDFDSVFSTGYRWLGVSSQSDQG